MLGPAGWSLALPHSQCLCMAGDDSQLGLHVWLFKYLTLDVFPVCGGVSENADPLARHC